jgi:hypothetical protein
LTRTEGWDDESEFPLHKRGGLLNQQLPFKELSHS